MYHIKYDQLKVGMNAFSNRIWCLNGKIHLDWLNLSFDSFKLKCKQLLYIYRQFSRCYHISHNYCFYVWWFNRTLSIYAIVPLNITCTCVLLVNRLMERRRPYTTSNTSFANLTALIQPYLIFRILNTFDYQKPRPTYTFKQGCHIKHLLFFFE